LHAVNVWMLARKKDYNFNESNWIWVEAHDRGDDGIKMWNERKQLKMKGSWDF
jgi:hypothetical protein